VQVEGRAGLRHLYSKVRHDGPGVLYHGAAASVAATFVGHFPWFTTVSVPGLTTTALTLQRQIGHLFSLPLSSYSAGFLLDEVDTSLVHVYCC
jgi:hypothetical protein